MKQTRVCACAIFIAGEVFPHCILGYKMAASKKTTASIIKCPFLAILFEKSIVPEANRLEPRSGPTYMGPDFGSSLFAISGPTYVEPDLFAILQKY